MKRSKRESFPLQVSDVPKQFDILFIGSADHLGEVLAKAGPAGRHVTDRCERNRLARQMKPRAAIAAQSVGHDA